MQKDEYGNEIKKIGRPLPVEYLLIDVPVTTPLQVTLHAFHLVCFVIILVWIINPISSHCKPSLHFLPAKILSLLKTASLNPAYRWSTSFFHIFFWIFALPGLQCLCKIHQSVQGFWVPRVCLRPSCACLHGHPWYHASQVKVKICDMFWSICVTSCSPFREYMGPLYSALASKSRDQVSKAFEHLKTSNWKHLKHSTISSLHFPFLPVTYKSYCNVFNYVSLMLNILVVRHALLWFHYQDLLSIPRWKVSVSIYIYSRLWLGQDTIEWILLILSGVTAIDTNSR